MLLGRFSHVRLCTTLWTTACQAPLSVGFSRQEYWSGLLCPPPAIFSTLGSNPCLLHCRKTLYHWATREAPGNNLLNYNKNYSRKDNRIRDFTMHSLQYGVRNLKTTDGLSWWLSGKESACQCRRHGFDPWSRKILHVAEQLSPCPTTIEPVLKSSRTTTPETTCHNCWCPSTLEPLIHSQRSHCSEKPKDHN